VIFLFSSSVLLVFGIWLARGEAASKFPLLILGIVSIMLILISVEKTYVSAMAILIIGTVVAQEDFLLKVAHMIKGSSVPVESYLQPGYDSGKSASIEQERLHQEVANEIEKVLGQSLSDPKKQQITDLLSQAHVADVTNRVRTKGATFPLGKYVKGGNELKDFLSSFATKDFFLQI